MEALNRRLDQNLKDHTFRGMSFLGGDMVQGDPTQDCALELLLKQGLPEGERLGLINCGCGAWLGLEADHPGSGMLAMHSFVEDHLACERNILKKKLGERLQSKLGVPTDFGEDFGSCDAILLRIYRDMAWNWIWIRTLLEKMRTGCALQILGRKDDGIRSIEKRLEGLGLQVESVAVGCHSRWIAIQIPEVRPPVGMEQASAPAMVSTPQGMFSLEIPEGLFAAGHLDAGTELLLENLGNVKGKSVWDFGCGAGVIARAALAAGASRVYGSDHSILAVRASEKNLQPFADRAKVGVHFLSDGVPDTYDLIISNPPFHFEARELRDLGRIWILSCLDRLEPGGEIRLVCNAFLPYGQFATDAKLKSEILVEKSGFRIYRLKK
jgi:16S rRNA (guanine1207-N2)-methyltransferase